MLFLEKYNLKELQKYKKTKKNYEEKKNERKLFEIEEEKEDTAKKSKNMEEITIN